MAVRGCGMSKGQGLPAGEDGADEGCVKEFCTNGLCTTEMRLKIVEASAEHDFVFRGSSECFVQCSASNFYSRTAFPNWRIPVCRRGKKAAPSASESPSAGLPRKIFYLPETLQTRINRPFLRNLHILRGALMFYPCQIAVY